MINLDVKELKEERGGHEHYEVSSRLPGTGAGDHEIAFTGPADISVDMYNSGSGIFLTGNIKIGVQLECARCLASFEHTVNTRFAETYYDAEKGVPRALQDAEEAIPFTGDEIDIQPEVVKAVVLGMPVKALCKNKCRGLCPVCGCNLNVETCNCKVDTVDPRMAKLKELLE